jgi:hypothetical protein
VATVTQMETVAQGLAVAEAAVAAAQSRVAMSEGSLERAEATLARPEGDAASAEDCCVILRAPSDGVVLSIATISEHPVQAGAPLLSVGDPTDLEIVADLLSSDAVRIGPGTRAIVERWGGPDPLEATLTRIEPAAETRVSALGIEEQRVDAIFAIETPPEDRPGPRPWLRGLPAHRGMGKRRRRCRCRWARCSGATADWAVFAVEDGVARERIVTIGQRGARHRGGAGGSGGGREDRHPPQRCGGRRAWHDRGPQHALSAGGERFSKIVRAPSSSKTEAQIFRKVPPLRSAAAPGARGRRDRRHAPPARIASIPSASPGPRNPSDAPPRARPCPSRLAGEEGGDLVGHADEFVRRHRWRSP